eukprot:TRINITY_DN7560_c0_g1_i1.p1 TRINITY_DN7560_c0_g1~~TRINITY_DN7560_c0_g1_i1.p1  ORF type:complete len:748 (-),score=168.05 TRINITY_DN7560_c0_g1_i1:227-2470(-)
MNRKATSGKVASTEDIVKLQDGCRDIQERGIEPFIKLIENQKGSFFKAKEFVNLYDKVFKMCIQRDPYNHTEAMYEKYKTSIQEYLTKIVDIRLTEVAKGSDIAFLKEWTIRWANQKLLVRGLSKLFMYLDRFYTLNTENVLNLKELGYKLFKEVVFDRYCTKARGCLLNAIAGERKSEVQDRMILAEAVEVFVEMGYNYADQKLAVYSNLLQKDIIEHAGDHYKRQSRVWMEQDSCPNYLEKAERVLSEEKARVESYMHRSTLEPLTKEVYTQVLKAHQTQLLSKDTGIFYLLSKNSREDLTRMYRLYSKYVEDLEPIATLVHTHILRAGSEIVDKAKGTSGEGEDHDLVKNLIDLHAQYADVVKVCFQNNQLFQKALKKAFEDFINKDERVSKMLALFVHELLRTGSKMSTSNIEAILDNVVFIYGYIQDKDVFERDYQNFLANRLIMHLCQSEHLEKNMIAKLKTECGYQWTNKLEGMFKDIQLSKDLMTTFKEVYDTEKSADMQLNVTVCTTGYWPAHAAIQASLPSELVDSCEKFKLFYLNKHTGHKIEWRLDQGSADVLVQFSPKVKRTLIVSTYQMMILLAFNQSKTCTYQQILTITGIPQNDIDNHLLSLAHPKVAVLEKRPNDNTLAADHKFRVNPKYMSKLLRIPIPVLNTGKKNRQNEVPREIIQARNHMTDAAVVRIMKDRQRMKHQQLVVEVIEQLKVRFMPKPADIKKRIEALIDQDYMKRDDSDRSTYNYVA